MRSPSERLLGFAAGNAAAAGASNWRTTPRIARSAAGAMPWGRPASGTKAMARNALFESFLDQPVLALTSDQDWAPDWALAALLEVAAKEQVPLHVFVTNLSAELDSACTGVTLGIHPNFGPRSSHGENVDDVIRTCLDLVPDATSF